MASDATKQTINQSLIDLKNDVAKRTQSVVSGVTIPELDSTLLISPTDQLILETNDGTKRTTLKTFGDYVGQGLVYPQELIDARNDANNNYPQLKDRLDAMDDKTKANEQVIKTNEQNIQSNTQAIQGNKQEIADLTTKHSALYQEVVDARTDNKNPNKTHDNLKERLDSDYKELSDEIEKTNTQLSQVASDSYRQTKMITTPHDYDGAIVTFIDDDAKANFFNIWKRVCDDCGIRVTLGVVPNWLGSSYYQCMTKEQLESLKDDGYDFACHTWDHNRDVFKPGVADFDKVTDEMIENEFRKGQEWMIENGYEGYGNLIYPWGGYPKNHIKRYKRLARKYFKNGVNASGIYNSSPNDNMMLNRTFISKSTDISVYKGNIDKAITDKSWLIFGTHSNDTEVSYDYLYELVRYIISKNIPILTLTDALYYKGNAVSAGEYTEENKCFIGHDGNVESNISDLIVMSGITPDEHGYSMDSSYKDFKLGKVTVFILREQYDTFLNVGGVINTYRVDYSYYYNYQTFVPYYQAKMFIRYVGRDGSWQDWKEVKMVGDHINVSINNINSNYTLRNMSEKLVRVDENEYHVDIMLESPNRNGTFSKDEEMFTFSCYRSTSVQQFLKTAIVTTNTGQAHFCPCWVTIDADVCRIKMFNNYTLGSNDIRWISFSFIIVI